MSMRELLVLLLTLTAFVTHPQTALAEKEQDRGKSKQSKRKARSPRKADPAIAVEDPSWPRLDAHCEEADALSVLASTETGWSDSYCGDTTRRVMEKGWWRVSAHLVSECRARGFKVASPVYKAKSNLNKQLNAITNLLSGPSAVISPAFQWAQSRDYILINVKFAHKLDTPATLGVESKGGADINERSLVFEAASKTKNKRFRLDLKLSRAVVPEESEWSMAAVGRATISLKKKHPETAWLRLLDSSQVPPQNMHTWWEMREQHTNDVKMLDTSMTDASAIAKAKAKAAEEAALRNETVKGNTTEAGAESSHNNGGGNKNNDDVVAIPAEGASTEHSNNADAADSADTSEAASDARVDPMLEAKRKELIAERAQARAAIFKEASDQVALVQQNKVRALDLAEADFESKMTALGTAISDEL